MFLIRGNISGKHIWEGRSLFEIKKPFPPPDPKFLLQNHHISSLFNSIHRLIKKLEFDSSLQFCIETKGKMNKRVNRIRNIRLGFKDFRKKAVK